MKKIYPTVMIALLLLPMQALAAEGSAIKVEYDWTSLTFKLSQQPKILMEGGNIVLKTNSQTVTLSLPCKVTPIGSSGTDIDKVVIQNNNDSTPINVFSIDGKKIGTLSDKKEVLSLERGLYIINGKKVLIK